MMGAMTDEPELTPEQARAYADRVAKQMSASTAAALIAVYRLREATTDEEWVELHRAAIAQCEHLVEAAVTGPSRAVFSTASMALQILGSLGDALGIDVMQMLESNEERLFFESEK